jgi:hypothetical protein
MLIDRALPYPIDIALSGLNSYPAVTNHNSCHFCLLVSIKDFSSDKNAPLSMFDGYASIRFAPALSVT